MSEPWREISRRKQDERKSRIPPEWRIQSASIPNNGSMLDVPRTCGLLTSRELSITESHSAVSLLAALVERKYTSLEVATAFCKRAAIAQQCCNCLTEVMFEDAMARAKWLDEEFARRGKPVGLLHGLPISLKDSFKAKGYDSTVGLAALAFKPAKENSTLVDILLEAGAVLYVKTNTPQAMMALDSHNNVFGRTLNPRNPHVTAGGSSGGEGALIAMRGSILGVGTDVGGSIRIPAMCNGVYGIKPSFSRIPFIGQESGGPPGMGGLGLKASAGPMATNLRDCELFLRVVSDSGPWERDPSVVFGEWRSQGTFPAKSLVGVLRSDGNTRPHPPVAKVLEETVQALKTSGVEVVEIDAMKSGFQKCNALANKFFTIEGGNNWLSLLESTKERLSPWLSTRVVGKRPMMRTETLLSLHAAKEQLEAEMLSIWRDENGRRLDAIICPVAPHVTPEVDRWGGMGYTSAFVMLDYPAGTLPIRDISPSDLSLGFSHSETPLNNKFDQGNRELWDGKGIDRKVYLESTLCVQVVVARLQERKLVGAMGVVEQALKKGGKKGDVAVASEKAAKL
ncbi:general amidase-like protein [Amylocarpus encephaloides]|uniref:amidase n=1 Tax=Amylocarpus encephaloides TaxID=45428 RepID=A0A9P8C6E5_9HELO|nr:general amidase-like protein [Amylocarpus encephaloides]